MGQTGTILSPKSGTYAYSWGNLGSVNVTWLLEAYVASSENGKIDTTQTTLTSSSLNNGNMEFVGALLYTKGLPANCIVPTASTTSKRAVGPTAGQTSVYTGSQSMSYRYKFPRTSAMDNYNAPFMDLSQGNLNYYDDITNTIRTAYFIGDKTANGLPTSISSNLNYKTQVDDVINDPQFCIDVVRDLKGTMGENRLNVAVKEANTTAYEKAKAYAYEIGDPNAAIERLYPDSPNPLVQWAIVATPMVVNEAMNTPEAFWITDDTTTGWDPHLEVITSTKYGGVAYLMDAYTQTWYNMLSHAIFLNEDYRYSLNDDYKVPLEYLESGASSAATLRKLNATSTPVQATNVSEDWGILRKEYGSLYYNLAECSQVDSKDANDHLLGIKEPSGTSWSHTTSGYATIGGITIALSKFDDTSIPVYYYITPDPDDPILPPGSATPPTFKPEPPEGTTVKKVVIPDKPLPNTSSENPPQDFPEDQPAVPKNPDGSYPIEPDDPPYILVECEQTEIPVYFHTFTFTNTDTSKQYKDVFEYLKDNKGIDESSATETIVCKETLPTLADNKTAQYKPAGASVIVDALSTSTTSTGDPWKSLADQISVQCNRNPSVCYYYATEYTERRDPMSKALGNKSVIYAGKTASKSATRSIHVKVYTLTNKQGTAGTGRDTDRIKTYDVTQYILVDNSATANLDSFSSYTNKDYNNYNNKTMQAPNSSHQKTNGAWIFSKGSTESPNKKVIALNYFKTSSCSFQYTHSHEYKVTIKEELDDDGNVKVPAHETTETQPMSCDYSCDAVIHDCKYLQEIPTVVYGKVSPPVVQKTYTSDGKTIADTPGWKQPTASNNPIAWSEVGLTVPGSYYDYKDVVKLASSKTFIDGSEYFLPGTSKQTVVAHGLTANKYAVFDVLFGKNGSNSKYWLQYLDNNGNVVGSTGHMQYTLFSEQDKKEDFTANPGDGKFDFMSSGTSIDKAQFLAHRDMLSGDNVAPSLAVSGYMTKYASNANSFDYLKLMRDAGFVFSGATNVGTISKGSDLQYASSEINTIGHSNRTIWIANSSSTSDLVASTDGSGKSEYNTNYTKGTDDPHKVRFGLGGTRTDGADVFDRMSDTNIKDNSVNTSHEDGDVARSIWYFTDYSEGNPAKGHEPTSYTLKAEHSSHVVCAEHGAVCGGHRHGGDPSVAKAHDADVKAAISRNKYALIAPDIYIGTMDRNKTHTSTNISGGSQTGAIDKIDTSREFTLINLAVEGTTAGKYDAAGKSGITYNSDLLKLTSGILGYTPSSELSGSAKNNQKSYEENTFEIKSAEYSELGSATRENDLLAEYRYTVPTRSYQFNPSYYMRFDDKLSDNNKSVWMLSNQPREINFKNIFSVRLVQPLAGSGLTESGAAGGYPTVVDSAWSTEKEDTNTQTVTGLPVLKAGNSYKAETAATEGTITAYVILQDPEFTGNPSDSQKNKEILQQYNAEMQQVLKELGAVTTDNALADSTSRSNAENNTLNFAMYTNMTNGSSTNSRFQIHGNNELKDKEPMVITHSQVSANVTTGAKQATATANTADLGNWEFYALQGNKVYPVMKNSSSDRGSIGYEGADVDISDTTSANNRKFLGVTVKTQSDATGYIASTLAELNKRLTGIMANGQEGNGLAYPSDTNPYKGRGNDFSWYTEDYEGFIVAVYNITFKIEGDGNDVNDKRSSDSGIVTDFSAAYRHESDWRQSTNALAEEKGHELKTPESYTKVANVANMYTHSSNLVANKDGTLTILTEDVDKILKEWSTELKNDYNQQYSEGIYGIGLELANVPIHFGSEIETQQSNSKYCKKVIGSSSERRSFFYQPTYFNVRGSVYDTTH